MAALFAIFLVLSCSGDADKDGGKKIENQETVEYINKICRTKPQEALDLLDKAEKTHEMRLVKINVLRSMIYLNAYYDTTKAMDYAMKAYNDPTIKNDTLPRITITRMLTALNYALSRYSQACAMATEGSGLAYAVGDQEALAYFYQFIAFTKHELGEYMTSYDYSGRSIKIYNEIISKQKHWVYYSDLFFVMLKEMQYLNDDGRYKEALDKIGPCEETLKQMATIPDTPEGLLDKHTAQYLSIACCVYYNNGNKSKADEGYRRMIATDYVATPGGQNVPAMYEALSGRYKEALDRTEKEIAAFKGKDTINTLYVNEVLQNGMTASLKLGYHERANNYMRRILGIKDSIYLRNQNQMALELSEIYETRDKDIQLIEKDLLLERNRLFLIMAAIIIVLALAAIALIIRYNRIIQKKNKAALRNIEEKLRLMQMVNSERTENKENAEERKLFDRIDNTIREKQLFLQPDFTRDTICLMLNINKAQLSSVVKTYANCSFPTYINRLRLTYAIELMKSHPMYSIEAIANECGMERVNFHRRFVEEFGITPSEFKKQHTD